MLLLKPSVEALRVITGSAVSLDYSVAWNDGPVGRGGAEGNIATAATTTIAPPAAGGAVRQIEELYLRNRHASSSQTVSVVKKIGVSDYYLTGDIALAAGEVLAYRAASGFMVYDSAGRPKLSPIVTVQDASTTVKGIVELATDGEGGSVVVQGSDSRLLTCVESQQNILHSPLPPNGAFSMISATAYFVYLGRVAMTFTPKYVEMRVRTAGVGTQTAECGLFSSPLAPPKAGQTLTTIEATGTVGDLTTTGVKRNTSAFSTSVAAGTHLWAGFRTALSVTQPVMMGLSDDWEEGALLKLVASGALTAASTFVGSITTDAGAALSPMLRISKV